MKMESFLQTLGLVCAIFVVSWCWKVVSWVWLKPKKMEKCLREQGIMGPPYKLLYGNSKELASAVKQARSKPMAFSHAIVPRVMPYVHQNMRTYGKLSYYWFGPVPRLTVMDPDMIKDILSERLGHIGKPQLNPLVKFLVKGLVEYEGQKWAKHRKILNPAFHLQKLKMMLPAFDTCCSEMVNKWKALVEEEESCELDVWPDIKNLTADVISRTAFGSNYEEGRRIFQLLIEQTMLVATAMQSIYIPGFRFLPTKRNKRMNENQNEIRTLLRNMILKREEAMKTGEAHGDLLGLLMESNFRAIKDGGNIKNVGMSIDDVIEECMLFYFVGQETTANLIVWTMIVLSMHPSWQEKAREEVLQVFAKGKLDFDGLSHLKVVTMILNEVLRLYPVATVINRTTHKECKLGKVTLPAGVQLEISFLLLHHDRELWGEDAAEFNPERFTEGISKATNNRLSYAPFSWGARICIGQNFSLIETKVAIAMILQNFWFELSPTYVHAPYTVATLQPQHGAPLILHRF